MKEIVILGLIITFSFMSISFVCAEDITATTEKGKKVILHDDGTWEYVSENKEKVWIQTSHGSYKIERFWEETTGDYTCSYTLVSYRNTTNKTFSKLVSIKAIVYDTNNKMLNMNTRSFFAYEYGSIIPGFEGVVKIPVECERGKASTVSVSIEKAD